MSTEAPWERYSSDFPVSRNLVYLNHASVSPLCRAAAEAMQKLAQDALDFGSLHYDRWLAAYENLRRNTARLIGCEASEVAIVKNTSEGIAIVAAGLRWKAGDKVVAFTEEFPSNYYPWKRLEGRGVNVHWLSAFASLDEIADACRGARLLAISHVQYLSGHRVDLTAIGEICRRNGTFFLVDAIQGMGAFEIDVRRDHIQALAADGHKWMMGPEGCGVLYIQRDRQDEIEPVEFGWTNTAHYADYASRDMTLRPDAGRYECGTLNTIGCFGLNAALEFILEVGVNEIGTAVRTRGDQVWTGVEQRGFEMLGRRTAQNGAGIVSFRKPGIDSKLIVRRLKDRGFMAAPRQGWVRVSPHFYQSPRQIEDLLAALDESAP
jgi:cysteine desulfurase/selenocysteine lyase